MSSRNIKDVKDQLRSICLSFDGRIGLHGFDLASREMIEIGADKEFPTASAIKLSVLTTLMAPSSPAIAIQATRSCTTRG